MGINRDKRNKIKSGSQTLTNPRLWVSIVAQQCIKTLQEANLISGVRAKFDTRKIAMLRKGDSRNAPVGVARTVCA
jgi:hypothetical protein